MENQTGYKLNKGYDVIKDVSEIESVKKPVRSGTGYRILGKT
jgi:hypothetical protein